MAHNLSETFNILTIINRKIISNNEKNNSKSLKNKIRGIGLYLILISSVIFLIAFLLMPKSIKNPNYNLFMISNVFIALGVYLILLAIMLIVKSLRKTKNKIR